MYLFKFKISKFNIEIFPSNSLKTFPLNDYNFQPLNDKRMYPLKSALVS